MDIGFQVIGVEVEHAGERIPIFLRVVQKNRAWP